MQTESQQEQSGPPTSQDLLSTLELDFVPLKSGRTGKSKIQKTRGPRIGLSDILIKKTPSTLRRFSIILKSSRLRQAFLPDYSKKIEDSQNSALSTEILSPSTECIESTIESHVTPLEEYLSATNQVFGYGSPLISEEIIEAQLLSEAYPNLAIIGQVSQDLTQLSKQESSILPQSKYITLPRTPLCLPPPILLQCPLPSIETMYTTLLDQVSSSASLNIGEINLGDPFN